MDKHDVWMVTLMLDRDHTWLDHPLTGFKTFVEARDAAIAEWPKLEEGESYCFYLCKEIIFLKEKNIVTSPPPVG